MSINCIPAIWGTSSLLPPGGVYRPTGVSYTSITPASPLLAYDEPSNPASVDTSTGNTFATTSSLDQVNILFINTYTFGSGTFTGTLRVAINYLTTDLKQYEDEYYEQYFLDSYVHIQCSINGGSSWIDFDQKCSWNAGSGVATPTIITKSLTNQNMANLKVRIIGESAYEANYDLAAEVEFQISDIVAY